MASPIVSEVVKHLEGLPIDLQTQVLNFVRKLETARERKIDDELGVASVTEVVSRIKAMPPNPNVVIRPPELLADLLQDEPVDTNFDLQKWQKEWDAAEAELKRINLEDDIAEGRI